MRRDPIELAREKFAYRDASKLQRTAAFYSALTAAGLYIGSDLVGTQAETAYMVLVSSSLAAGVFAVVFGFFSIHYGRKSKLNESDLN